jgi:hypothetical protein
MSTPTDADAAGPSSDLRVRATVHGKPLRAGAPSWADVEASELLGKHEAGRLEFVHRRAEKWTAGLTALTALISVTLIGRAPESIRQIDQNWRIGVGVLLILALASLAIATYCAYRSAYGELGRLNEVASQPVSGLAERLISARHQATIDAQRHIRQAAIATVAGVVLIALAIGVTWYAPPGATSSPGVTVCVLVGGKAVTQLVGARIESIQPGTMVGPCP